MMMPMRNFGQKIDYDPLWSGPLNKQRSPTDVAFRKCLGYYYLIWLGTAVYAYIEAGMYLTPRNEEHHRAKRETSLVEFKIVQAITTSFGPMIFSVIMLPTLLSMAYIYLLRWTAKCMVYCLLSLIITFLIIGILVGALFYNSTNDPSALAAVIFGVVLLIPLSCLVLKSREKLNIAFEVIKEASKCLSFFPNALLFPLLPMLIFIVALIFSLSVAGCLAFVSINQSAIHIHMIVFHVVNVIGILTTLSAVISFTQMVLAGSFATWYWSHAKEQIPSNTISRFMKIIMRYHFGTVVHGCLNVPFVYTPPSEDEDSCSNICFRCCMSSSREDTRRVSRYVNRHALIMCAIHGTKFSQSSRDAFNLIFRNMLRCLTTDWTIDGILLIGGLIITGISILVTFLLTQEIEFAISALIISGLVVMFFFIGLRIAIDTIFLCVLEDCERNDGSAEKPYYMSEELKQIFLDQGVHSQNMY